MRNLIIDLKLKIKNLWNYIYILRIVIYKERIIVNIFLKIIINY